jgi:hypothetical protein
MEWNSHIKKFEKYGDDDYYNDPEFNYDDEELNYYYNIDNNKDREKNTQQELDDDLELSFENLAKKIRAMIKNGGFKNANVNVQDKDFFLEFVMEQDKKFSNFMSLISLLEKINKDILVGYESVIDLWYDTSKKPLITVDFYHKSIGRGNNYNLKDNLPY